MHTLRLLWAAHNKEIWTRRQRRINNRKNLEKVREMPELLFIERFRLDKQTFRQLCHDLRSYTSLRGTIEIPLEIKILCTLSFLATGSYQRIVGISQHLPQRTTSRCIKQVVEALNHKSIVDRWIVFPQSVQERSRLKQEFQRKFNLPGVIGCIDCTHVAIVKPHNDEHLFFSRKGYHSINVQMVCDSNLRIINVNAKYGGAAHDSFIWSSSQVEMYMRRLHQSGEQAWLLGDSGYPLRPWLLTPILDAAPGSPEEVYTTRHIQCRNCIERCFGLLKSRWRCLLKDRTLHYHPSVASKIIVACCVLHNIALNSQIPVPNEVPIPHEDDNAEGTSQMHTSTVDSELIQGRAVLNCLINRL